MRSFFRSVAVAGILLLFQSASLFSQVSFTSSGLAGENLNNPTSLQFGPDGRLYVSQQNGTIYAYTIAKNGPNDYQVTNTETILLVKQIQNHNDDGSVNSGVNNRQVTGILVTGTSNNPVLYVGSSDPRIGGAGKGGDQNLDTNSGTISKLTWNGSSWDKVDVVRGLPRSEENHANNGMQLDEVNNILYVAQGGHTNAGAPSTNFAFQTEYALSAAILAIDLDMIETQFGGAYDLPTLDDPTRPNTGPNGADQGDPFGGNDGLNQAKVVPGGPVQIYSPGYRNIYDVVRTKTPGKENRIYTIDNGPNKGWGGHPDNEGAFGNPLTTTVTNNYVQGEPGSAGSGPNDGQVNNLDNLHLVSKPGMSPIYAGHPCPIRANPSGAGLYYRNSSNQEFFDLNPTVDWPPVPVSMANPVESDYRNPGVNDGALYTWPASTNGIAEYTATNFFGGALTGDLLAASFDGNIYQIELNQDGTQVLNVESLAAGFGSIPLDVIAQGTGEIFEGTIWAVTYGADNVTIFEPENLENIWQELSSSDNSGPTARHENAYVEVAGKFYLIGGRGNKPVDIYDPVTNTWTTGSQPPVQMHHFQAIAFQGLIYVIGAFTGGFPNETPISNIYIYDPVLDNWSVGDEIPANRRRGSAGVVVHDNKIYMVCGIQNGHVSGWVPWLDVYDPVAKT
ncbi:MAG: hypothetical protein MI975_12910, partial [Cytophagales bacterium]|nr:hypothetical protein [Cytophagales bacterium]